MMRCQPVILTLLLGLLSFEIEGQCVVAGKVTDATTHESLPGVYVLYGKERGTATDNAGNFRFTGDSGRYTVTFRYIGYSDVVRQVNLRYGDSLDLSIEMHPETQMIGQVVISADRIEHKISELTVSVDVIKSDFLEINHITDAQELITKTPGIEVLDGQASIRGGSGFSYGVGSRVLALVDGLPLLTADAGSIRWQYLPVENLSQVEIIKGASSVLYGSSALNGIISFRTADASNIPSTHFFTEAGLYDKPKDKKWVWWSTPRVFSTVSFSHLRRIKNTDLGVSINLFTDNSYRKYNDEKLGKVNLRLKHFDNKIKGMTYGVNITGGLTAKTDFLLWEDADSGALKQDTSSVSFLHGRYLAIDPFISYSRTGIFRHDLRMRIQSSGNRFPVKYQNDASTFSIYTEYQLFYRLSELLSLTVGASETWNKIISNFFGNHQEFNAAGFAQAEIRPVDRLKLVAGIRLEDNILDSRADKPVPVFRAGINWQAAGYTYLRASFGQGYRFPSIAEKFASTTLGSVRIFPNPYIQPESGWSSEAGIKQGIMIGKITGQADLSVFFSQNKNMIEYLYALFEDPYTHILDFGFQATNIEQSRVYGTEIEFQLKRQSRELISTFSGGYTFMYPVEFDPYTHHNKDIYLKYRRKHFAKLTVGNDWKRINSEFSFYVRSKTLNIDDIFTGPEADQILPGFHDYWQTHNTGYFLMDMILGYNLNTWLNISLAIKNLTNTEYMGRPADIQPPRNISLRLSGKI
jgi:outer membrane cobalamin receptor